MSPLALTQTMTVIPYAHRKPLAVCSTCLQADAVNLPRSCQCDHTGINTHLCSRDMTQDSTRRPIESLAGSTQWNQAGAPDLSSKPANAVTSPGYPNETRCCSTDGSDALWCWTVSVRGDQRRCDGTHLTPSFKSLAQLTRPTVAPVPHSRARTTCVHLTKQHIIR